MKRLWFWLSLAIVACVEEIELTEVISDESEAVVEVVLEITGCEDVKSVLSVDENAIVDLLLVIYRNGIQEYRKYFSSPQQSLKLDLIEGQSYNMYLMANAGKLPAYLNEQDFREGCVYSIKSISEISDILPMAWSCMDVKVAEGMGSIDVQLERLAAKIVFSLDKRLMQDFHVTSVELCQCASTVRPFKYMNSAGSRVEDGSEIISGDMATEADLADLNNGGNICFYTLENCQGVLLPDNESSSLKLPDAIGEKSELCTYLEVSGRFGSDGFLEGEVKYRFYLGLDACSSFDVPGNACIDVKLQLTDAGLREVSWRVEADVSVRDGYAWGSVEHGLHDLNDLYVGERLLYRVEVSDEIISYMGGDMDGCSLLYESDNDGVTFTPLQGADRVYVSEISCKEVSRGKLYLRSRYGEKLALLCPDVKVNLPKVVVSEYAVVDDGEPVEGLTYAPECVVNGQGSQMYVYLADSRKTNLNSSSAYGFDLDAFDFSLSAVGEDEELSSAFATEFVAGVECSGGYASKMFLKCIHDGKDAGLAQSLVESYGEADFLPVVITDQVYGLTGYCSVSLGILPVTLTLVDNRWAGHHSTQLSMLVDNKSELPLEVIVYQMVDNNKVWSSSFLTTELREHVERHLVRKDISYITCSVNKYEQTMHMAKALVRCAGSGVFPLEGIETDDLMNSLVYDGFGQDRMYHLVDVTAGGYGLHKSDVSLINKLSDGSSLYDTIYLSDWESKGVWLYSNDELLQSAGNYLVHYPNVSPMKIDRMRQRHEDCPGLSLLMWYDGEEFRGYVSHAQGIAYGVTMTVRFYGQVQGYVQTDPKGIWGSVRDNYCTSSFDNTVKEVPLADFLSYVSMDGGAVRQAMDAIYAQTFEDKKDGKKFQHSAHPVSIDCNVEIYVESKDGEELYPMRVSWEYPYVQYHHAQDEVTYTCQMALSVPCFNIVMVDRISSE